MARGQIPAISSCLKIRNQLTRPANGADDHQPWVLWVDSSHSVPVSGGEKASGLFSTRNTLPHATRKVLHAALLHTVGAIMGLRFCTCRGVNHASLGDPSPPPPNRWRIATRLYFFFRSPMFHLGGPDSLRVWFDRNSPCSQKSNKQLAKRKIKVPYCTQCAATRCTSTITPSDTALRAIRARSTFQSSQILDGSSSSVLLIRSVLRRLRLVAAVAQALSPAQP